MSEFRQSLNEKERMLLRTTPAGKFMRLLVSKLSPWLDSHPEEDSYLRQLELTNIIKIFFDFTYHLGASPFRFAKDVGSGYYYVKVWRPQQILCAVLHILCTFRLIAEIRESIPKNSKTLHANPTPYFDIAMGICGLLYKWVTMKTFWLRKEQYLKVLNFILKEKYLPIRNMWVTKPYFIYALFGFNTLKILSCFISGYLFVVPVMSWSPSWWLRRLVAHGRFVFGFVDVLPAEKTPQLKDISFSDGILAVLVALGQVERWIMGEFCDLCILAAALTLWTTASSFASDIADILRLDEEWDEQTENGELPRIITVRGAVDSKQRTRQNVQPWQLIYRRFQAIQNLSDVINTALGNQVTWYMAEGLMYYSISLNTVFLTNDEFKRFHKIVFYILTFNILYVSSDICNKMESAKHWLVKNNNIKTVPSDEANLVLHESITKDIGIRGSGVFTLTFPLSAGFLSLIVTFFIICVQQNDVKT